jgi:amidase
MGTVRGLPVGISFIGRAWSEATLLVLGAGFESATHARRAPTWLPSIENSAAANAAFAPVAGGIIR